VPDPERSGRDDGSKPLVGFVWFRSVYVARWDTGPRHGALGAGWKACPTWALDGLCRLASDNVIENIFSIWVFGWKSWRELVGLRSFRRAGCPSGRAGSPDYPPHGRWPVWARQGKAAL